MHIYVYIYIHICIYKASSGIPSKVKLEESDVEEEGSRPVVAKYACGIRCYVCISINIFMYIYDNNVNRYIFIYMYIYIVCAYIYIHIYVNICIYKASSEMPSKVKLEESDVEEEGSRPVVAKYACETSQSYLTT